MTATRKHIAYADPAQIEAERLRALLYEAKRGWAAQRPGSEGRAIYAEHIARMEPVVAAAQVHADRVSSRHLNDGLQ